MGIFKKRKYFTVNIIKEEKNKIINIDEDLDNEPNIPDGLWIKCNHCGKILYTKTVEQNHKICTNCNGYFRLGAYERLEQICDEDTFKEFNLNMKSKNPMNFPKYEEKLEINCKKSGLIEAVVTGVGNIGGEKTVIAVMDSHFMMGSMGSVVGEKITTAIELATKNKLPIIIFTASGGARMQEGIVSLMQMAKISAALAKHSEKGLLYITVLTDPTTGGVTASFAMLGDIILSETKALIGFAGRRVIEGTLKESLPEDFQSAEFLLEKGFIDAIIERENLKNTIAKLLKIHSC